MSNPTLYLFLQGILGAKRARFICVRDYMRPAAGQRVLDVGCGPGYVIEYFPKCEYVGFDIDQDYVRYANQKYGHKGTFYCQELDDDAAKHLMPFDLIIMNGLLHHLKDDQVTKLLRLTKAILKPRGKIVTLDGCYTETQSNIAKKLLDYDRGKFVRKEKDYVRLVSAIFPSVDAHIRHDLMLIPYTLLIMQLSSL